MDGNSSALYNQYNGPTSFQPRFRILLPARDGSRHGHPWRLRNLNFTRKHRHGQPAIPEPALRNSAECDLCRWHASAAEAAPSIRAIRFSDFGLHRRRCARDRACLLPPGPVFTPSTRTMLPWQVRSNTTSPFSINWVILRPSKLATSARRPTGGGDRTHQAKGPGAGWRGSLPAHTLTPRFGPRRPGAPDHLGRLFQYNALQASFQHRLSRGLEFQGNYTLSKCLGNSSGFFAGYGDTSNDLTQAGNNHFFFQNTYNPAADYGRCDQNIANAFNGFVTYDNNPSVMTRQFGSDMNRVADLIVGGWQVNSILQFHTGFPITAQAADNSGTTSGFPRADCDGGPDQTPWQAFDDSRQSRLSVVQRQLGLTTHHRNLRRLPGW